MSIMSLVRRLQIQGRKRLLNSWTLKSMRKVGSPIVAQVAEALAAHQRNALSPVERRWLTRIEKIRDEICASCEIVPVPDYGAGTPADTRSESMMLEGIVTHEVVGEACASYSKAPLWAAVLFHLIRHRKPGTCFELGTCLGISACYQSSALELNGLGQLTSFEGVPSFASIATKNLALLGLAHRASVVVGRFADTLPGALAKAGGIDYAFIDGHHDEHATISYFEALLPHLSAGAMLVFDDIDWSQGMQRAWKRISEDSRVDVSIDLGKMGVCLARVGARGQFKVAVG